MFLNGRQTCMQPCRVHLFKWNWCLTVRSGAYNYIVYSLILCTVIRHNIFEPRLARYSTKFEAIIPKDTSTCRQIQGQKLRKKARKCLTLQDKESVIIDVTRTICFQSEDGYSHHKLSSQHSRKRLTTVLIIIVAWRCHNKKICWAYEVPRRSAGWYRAWRRMCIRSCRRSAEWASPARDKNSSEQPEPHGTMKLYNNQA